MLHSFMALQHVGQSPFETLHVKEWCMVQKPSRKLSVKELEKQAQKGGCSSKMEILLVRTIEKMLDSVNNNMKPTSWNVRPSKVQGLRILQVSSLESVHQATLIVHLDVSLCSDTSVDKRLCVPHIQPTL